MNIIGIACRHFTHGNRQIATGDRIAFSVDDWRSLAARGFIVSEREHEERLERERVEERERYEAARPERERQERIAANLAAINAKRDAKLAEIRAATDAEIARLRAEELAALVEVEAVVNVLVPAPAGHAGQRRLLAGERLHIEPHVFVTLARKGYVRAVERHEERMRDLEAADLAAARAELSKAAEQGDDGARRALAALEESVAC